MAQPRESNFQTGSKLTLPKCNDHNPQQVRAANWPRKEARPEIAPSKERPPRILARRLSERHLFSVTLFHERLELRASRTHPCIRSETVSQLVSKMERHQLHSIPQVSSSARPGQAADNIRDVLSWCESRIDFTQRTPATDANPWPVLLAVVRRSMHAFRTEQLSQ